MITGKNRTNRGWLLFFCIWLGAAIFLPPCTDGHAGTESAATLSRVAESSPPSLPPAEGLTQVLSGKIFDPQRQPLRGVRVSLNNPPFQSVLTGDDGTFHLPWIPVDGGLAQLEIYRQGYFPLHVLWTFDPQRAEPPVFVIVPLPPVPPLLEEGQEEALKKGALQVEADRFLYEREGDIYRARGDVVMVYEGASLTAAAVDLYRDINEAAAEGQVILRSTDGDVLEGEKARLDLVKKTGSVDIGRIFMAKNHFYIRGDRIEKRGEATYFVVNAEATSCDGESPDWRLAGKELNVTVDGYGTLTHGRFYAKNRPVLYCPYLLFPAKTTRQSGFLLPQRMAYSQNKVGWDVSIPFFWAVSQNADATFHQRYMSERGFQEGIELRYALSSDSYGVVYGDYLRDGKKMTETVGNLYRDWQSEHNRWALYLNHESRFDPTMYLRADVAKVSDSFYFKDFSSYNYFLANHSPNSPQPFRQIGFVGDESLATLDSTVRLVKNWDNYNLTALVKSTQDFSGLNSDGVLQKYPEIALTGVKQALLGSPVHYELSGIYDYFSREKGQTGHLLDAYPSLSMPLGFKDLLQMTPFAGVRSLLWKRDDTISDGLKKDDHLEVYSFGASLSSEIHRVFTVGTGNVDKIRHAIRPEVTYLYSPYAKLEHLPSFVSAAIQQNTANNTLAQILSVQSGAAAPAVANDLNVLVYGVTNTLTARIYEPGGQKRYVEFLRCKIAQAYDIRESKRDPAPNGTDRRPFGDMVLELDLAPLRYASVSARNSYSVHDNNWTQENYDLVLQDHRGDSATLTYRYTRNVIKETNLHLKAAMTKKLDLHFRLKRDHLNEREIEKVYGFDYRSQCWSVGFDYGETTDGAGRGDRVYAARFSLVGL
jgi:LPS-assembly protein